MTFLRSHLHIVASRFFHFFSPSEVYLGLKPIFFTIYQVSNNAVKRKNISDYWCRNGQLLIKFKGDETGFFEFFLQKFFCHLILHTKHHRKLHRRQISSVVGVFLFRLIINNIQKISFRNTFKLHFIFFNCLLIICLLAQITLKDS